MNNPYAVEVIAVTRDGYTTYYTSLGIEIGTVGPMPTVSHSITLDSSKVPFSTSTGKVENRTASGIIKPKTPRQLKEIKEKEGEEIVKSVIAKYGKVSS